MKNLCIHRFIIGTSNDDGLFIQIFLLINIINQLMTRIAKLRDESRLIAGCDKGDSSTRFVKQIRFTQCHFPTANYEYGAIF